MRVVSACDVVRAAACRLQHRVLAVSGATVAQRCLLLHERVLRHESRRLQPIRGQATQPAASNIKHKTKQKLEATVFSGIYKL